MKPAAPERDVLAEGAPATGQVAELQLAAQAKGWRKYWLFLTHVVTETMGDDLPLLGAALAHYALMSIIPLLLLTAAFFGVYLKSERAQDQALQLVSQYLVPSGRLDSQADLAEADPSITWVFKQMVDQRGTVGGFGFLILLWISLRIFITLQRALDHIWKIERHLKRPLYLTYPMALGSIATVGLIAWLSVALTSVVSSLRFQWPQRLWGFDFMLPDLVQTLSIVVSVLMSTLLMYLIFRFLPSARVRSRSAFYGAVTAGILWEVVKHVFAWWLNYGAEYARFYGAMAGLVILVFWTYVSAMILLLGAEVVYCHATYISAKPVVEEDLAGPQPDTPDGRQGTAPSPPAVDPADAVGED